MAFTLGIDYGSNSVRAIVVDCSNGRELGSAVVDYPSGEHGILLHPGDHNLARQRPGDYFFGLQSSVRGALERASEDAGFSAQKVIGIGVDTTGSSPLPVDEHNVPLGLRDRLYDKAHDATTAVGTLCPEWSQKLGLSEGIPVAIGEFDVHYGAIGSGVDEGVFVKAIGTSTCDCCVVHADKPIADIPGICGIVKSAILPGYYGIEAGQSAVGDLFKWWVDVVCEGRGALHATLTREAAEQRPGQSGLLALDWNNGNRASTNRGQNP
jgi:ribulose kinase